MIFLLINSIVMINILIAILSAVYNIVEEFKV